MGKKVLVVGSGGREHALVWKLSQSPMVDKVYIAPGNAGTIDSNVPIAVNDIRGLVRFARSEAIDLVVVGPEEPLSLGLADALQEAGIKVFGPTQAASRLESSKAFAKEIMDLAQIPTAKWQSFDDPKAAKDYLLQVGAPRVIKADGLAAGKGVIVAQTLDDALRAVDEIMLGSFGDAGKRVVIEEFLIGQEVSLLCFCDGKKAKPMVAVQDHKRVYDDDKGPNTGGMGTYSPPPFWTPDLEQEVMTTIVNPVLEIIRERGTPFQGVLFVGLMVTDQGPRVLEFNVRFGDPETQVVMMRLQSDLYPILEQCADGQLDDSPLAWSDQAAVCVVMASPGYPLSYPKGIPIQLPPLGEGEMIFHAGTAMADGRLVSAGGRVLGVCALGRDLAQARANAYALVDKVDFPGGHYRRDIGIKGLRH